MRSPLATSTLWACGLMMLLAAGCSQSEFVPVTGTVTWNGAPLTDGEVIFTPEDTHTPPGAGKLKDGAFEFLSKPGKVRVEVQAVRKTGKRHPIHGFELTELYIPARYNTETELTAEVTPGGANNFKFDLKQ